MWPQINQATLLISAGGLISLVFVACLTLSLDSTHQVDCHEAKSQPNITIKQQTPVKQLASFLNQQPGQLLPADQQSSVFNHRDDETNEQLSSLSSLMLKGFIRGGKIRAYHLDLHSYRDGAKFAGDPSFVSSENPEHLDRCSRHLNAYHRLLKSFNELDPILDKTTHETLHLANYFGRPEAGSLFGNQFWLGSYEECLDFRNKQLAVDVEGRVENINSQYCLGISQFPNWRPEDGGTSVKIGLCLPETCTSSMLNEHDNLLETVDKMMKYQFGGNQPFSRLKLRQVYCLPHETSQIRQFSASAIGFFTVVGLFTLSCLAATLVDYSSSKLPENLKTPELRTWRTKVVESFSLIRNLEKFLHINADPPEKDLEPSAEGSFDRSTFLNSITGLKCLGLCLIICAHAFLVGPIPANNILAGDKLTKTYLANVYLTAHLMVDTFFALSGILASYFIFSSGISKIRLRDWIFMTIHRYWRLTPVYLLCYWFTKSVGFVVNSGPLWDYKTAEVSPRLNCERESWWHAILHVSDFKSPKEHCVPFAWFIANGIKFWMVTPFFLLLINKSVRRGYMATMSAIVASIILVSTLAFRSEVDMKSVIEFRPESADNMLDNMGEVYTRPYSRIGAYLVGLLAGHILYLIDTRQAEFKLSKNAKFIIWTLFSVTVVVLAFAFKLAAGVEIDEAVIPWLFSISAGLIRPLWAVCTCWLVFGLAHGHARWAAKFLSANFWRILVRLSFCAYLVQGEVIAHTYLARTYSAPFTYTSLITEPIVTIVLTMAVSFLMVLLLEYPLVGIEELILPRRQKKGVSEKREGTKVKTT